MIIIKILDPLSETWINADKNSIFQNIVHKDDKFYKSKDIIALNSVVETLNL